MGFCPLGNSGGIFSSLHKLTRCCPMDFSNPCPQVDFPGQTWYYSSKLGNWRFRVPVFCMALRAASLYPRTPARLLHVTASLQPLTRFCLLHVIASHVLATAHTSFLLHVIASQCAHWRGNPFSPQRSLATWYYFRQIRCFSVFTQSIPFRYVLPQELRIAPSLRSSQ